MTTAKTKNPSRAAKAAKEAADLMAQNTKQEPNFFLSFLKKYFVLIEQADSPVELLVVGQPISRWLERQKKA